MKKTTAIILFLLTLLPAAKAQDIVKITLNNGQTITIPVDSIADMRVAPVVPEALKQLAGQWQFIASANGSSDGSGIFTATTDTISFTATVAPDGMGLICRAEQFYTRSGNVYPATWRMVVEQQDDRIRIGMVLDDDEPASELEFNEPKENYLENGFFYWGSDTDEHHYIYLLSENIETQRIEAMTLWSGWMPASGDNTYSLPQNQQIYGIVATAIPYTAGHSCGYFEIWASARLKRISPS